jgi:hypothetical protein
LSALKAHDEYYGTYSSSSSGDDSSGFEGMMFDSMNFSVNRDAGIWKMEFGLFGSLPIRHTDSQKYSIISTDNYTRENILKSGCQKSLPERLYGGLLGSGWSDKD